MNRATSISQDHQISLIIPNDGNALLLNIDAQLQPIPSPVIEQLAKIHDRLEASATAARAIDDRSNEFVEFAKGIVLYDTDVHLGGSWKAEALIVPSIPVESIDERVQFNQNIWIPGMDVIVDDLDKKMAELESLITAVENRLNGEHRQFFRVP